MAQVEPMDIDSVGSDFDDKENSLLNSNVLPRTPCTEKGYEELDVSELNMKLRYSITPASSPMSKSFTSCKDNKTYSINEDSLNSTLVNNTNLTRSLNSSIVKCDITKSPKLPLQALPTDQYLDINSTVRRSFDNDPNNITITLNGIDNIDENLSLPSTSSSAVQTPEATTPTKEIPKDEGSPIMRGLKSVLNMFRSSQSPIPPEEIPDKKESTESRLEEEPQNKPELVLASTPKANDKNTSKRSSPLKESVTFNDDLERELQWKDDSTIIFKQEKIPIHKLFLQQSTSLALDKKMPPKLNETQNLNSTVEYMDISYNESGFGDKTMTDIDSKVNNIEVASGVESDAEFLDCETTYTKNEQTDSEKLNRTIPVNIEENDSTQEVPSENVTSQIDEQEVANMDKDTAVISTNLSSFENNVQIKEHQSINDESRALNDNLSDKVNESIVTESVVIQEQLECVKDEIHINKEMKVTAVLDVSADKIQFNDKDQSVILDQHNLINNDLSKTIDFVNDNLSNTFNCPVNDSKHEKQLTFDVTMPLNIVTGDHSNNVINDNASNNFELIDKEHEELNETNVQSLSSGILQICENVSGTVHEYANNTFNVLESTLNVEENKTDTFNVEENKNNIENKQILIHSIENSQETNLTAFISNDNLNEESTFTNIDTQKLECDIIKQCSLEHITDSPILNKQPDFKGDDISTWNNDEIQNNIEKLIENRPNINDLDQIKLQNVEENAKLDEPPLDKFVNDLPSDVPLPSDDDIEKDSLMDNFVINNDNDVEELDVKTLDSLETIDVFSQGTVITNFEYSNDLNNILPATNTPLANLDQIQSNIESITENISNSPLPLICDLVTNRTEISVEISNQNQFLPTSECEILSKTELIMESAPMDILDDKTMLPDTISELNQTQQYLNNIKTLNGKDSASFARHVECQPICNESPNVEDIETEEQNCNITNEECKKNKLNEPSTVIDMDTKKHKNDEVELSSLEHTNDTPISCKNEILNDVELKEKKVLDEEIMTSANNSPYVSVNDLDLNIRNSEMKLDEIESPFETKSRIATSPPISPKLSRKGYNINFDEIDDPFATKTNIRMSPPLETSPKNLRTSANISQKKPDIQKRVQQQNRRKSQPERQKRDFTKKRFNSSYSCDTRNNKFKEQMNTPINENDNNKLIKDNKIDQSCTITTPVIDADNLETIETKKCDVDNFDISNKNLLNQEEIIKEEIKSPNVEPTDNNSSTHNSAANIPAKNYPAKNVFNLPEIDDMNFNPFVSKSKIRNSPSPTFEKESTLLKENNTPSGPSLQMTQQPIENLTLNIEKNTQENKVESDISSENCSSKNTDRDLTVQEVATEDEDTGEAPFLEAEEFADVVKVSDFGSETDMMQFEDIRPNINNENKDEGELFIDAEAFEFLLNQNKSNTVADSGKESLFLKFDPLFAKRVSSDGVLAALSRIQRRQSTPKKAPETSNRNNVIDEATPSVSSTNVEKVLEESNDESNITVTKPMMVVNPAINSLVSPRKSTTPPRINRRSLTFTSPAMAVIDRLLSLSGNSSTLEHETSLPRTNREYNETDIALTQLRELLAEKEIHVHNLRSESKELKERLATMESQVKTLEKESEERLKKVNDLNDRLTEKSKINKSMAVVVEEYERTIASLIAEMEQEKRRNAEERAKIISERDEQTAHLSSMEVSFSDLHSKYEKSKQIILSMKANEDTYKKSIKDFEDNLLKMQNNYELLKQHATSKLNHANQELEKFNRAHESEVLKLNAMIKRKELHITSLEESLAQKTKANEELTAICDELINKVG